MNNAHQFPRRFALFFEQTENYVENSILVISPIGGRIARGTRRRGRVCVTAGQHGHDRLFAIQPKKISNNSEKALLRSVPALPGAHGLCPDATEVGQLALGPASHAPLPAQHIAEVREARIATFREEWNHLMAPRRRLTCGSRRHFRTSFRSGLARRCDPRYSLGDRTQREKGSRLPEEFQEGARRVAPAMVQSGGGAG
jgi:hypothetical protein